MAVKLITSIQRWTGLSTDTKPTPDKNGSTFYEADTGRKFVWHNSDWIEDLGVNKIIEMNNESRRLLELQLIKLDEILTSFMK